MPTAPPPSRDAAIEARVFWLRFQKEIAWALIVLLMAILAWTAFRIYTDKRDSAASGALANAKNAQDYQQVIDRYPKAPAAVSAYLLLAETQRQQKKFVEANTTLQRFISTNPNNEFVPTAYLAMAANLESLGKTDEALAQYQRVATNYPDNYAAPLALISQVNILKAQKRIEDARRICETILIKYRIPSEQPVAGVADNRPASMWAAEAMRQLHLLKPAEPQKSAAGTASPAVPPMLAAPSPATRAEPSVTPSNPIPQKSRGRNPR